MDSKYLGHRIREMRNKKNRSSMEIADYLGINRATLSKYENGTITPTLDTFIKFVLYFNCSPNELLQDYLDISDDFVYYKSIINSLALMSRADIKLFAKELENFNSKNQ